MNARAVIEAESPKKFIMRMNGWVAFPGPWPDFLYHHANSNAWLRIKRIDGGGRLIVWRFELRQNGNLLGALTYGDGSVTDPSPPDKYAKGWAKLWLQSHHMFVESTR
jgi:hypothetical protein